MQSPREFGRIIDLFPCSKAPIHESMKYFTAMDAMGVTDTRCTAQVRAANSHGGGRKADMVDQSIWLVVLYWA